MGEYLSPGLTVKREPASVAVEVGSSESPTPKERESVLIRHLDFQQWEESPKGFLFFSLLSSKRKKATV